MFIYVKATIKPLLIAEAEADYQGHLQSEARAEADHQVRAMCHAQDVNYWSSGWLDAC